MRRGTLSPAGLFDAAVHPGREHELAGAGLQVVARPGMAAPIESDPGDRLIAIHRGLGEGRLAIVSPVERIVPSRAVLEAEGVPCEGYGDGVFIEVDGGPTGRRGLRIAGPERTIARHVVLLREAQAARPARPAAEDTPSEPDAAGVRPLAAETTQTPATAQPTEWWERASALPSPRETTADEAIDDPIAPPRAPLAITGSVGRGARNQPADVRAVQTRLVELRVLDAAAAAAEQPGAAALVEGSLPRTIEAIESFQRQMAIPVDGTVDVRGSTRTELDLANPLPTPDELSAIATELGRIGQSVSRGLTITGPVGATATGNAVEDVRAVQRRLVELGTLTASHRESPAAGATGTVAQTNLTATIAALRRFQSAVRLFVSKGAITGAIASGVARPGDATATLLDRISVYTMTLGPARISFRDHVPSTFTHSEAGVAFSGTAAPAALPASAYPSLDRDARRAANVRAALQLVSTFEGNFDAINTYDRAIVSVGFIQFAGGRGLPPYMALLKARQAAKFRDLLQKFGIDVEYAVTNGAITGARMVLLDPAGTRVLRATAAETAMRDDKRLTTALILSGRDRDVQLLQIEAAVLNYVRPALNATVTWAPARTARLGALLRSQKGLAMLFDRAIQEGLGAARRRFERVVQRVVRSGEPRPLPNPPPAPPTLEDLQRREGDLLAEIERDLQSARDVGTSIARALTLLATLIGAAGAAGATVAVVLARPELADARRAVTEARVGLAGVVNLTTSSPVDTVLARMNTTLTAEESRLALTPAPSSIEALTAALTASRQALAGIAGPLSTAPTFLGRIQRIRRSTLDSGLAEVA